MKRVVLVWIVCAVVSLGSFALLTYQDRRLGVALPYGLPLAFVAMTAAAPALLALFEWLRARRPIVVRAAPVVEKPPVASAAAAATTGAPFRAARRPRGVEGVVLLDHATVAAVRRRVA